MNTFLELEVRVTLSLADRNARDLAETKIDTLIGNQPSGSYSINEFKENPNNVLHPYWFYTRLFIIVPTFSDLVTIRSTIISGLENNFTEQEIIGFEFDPLEKKS